MALLQQNQTSTEAERRSTMTDPKFCLLNMQHSHGLMPTNRRDSQTLQDTRRDGNGLTGSRAPMPCARRRRSVSRNSCIVAMRVSSWAHSLNSTGLRRGLSSAHWSEAGEDDPEQAELEVLREREAAQQRQLWVVEQMQKRESEFTTSENMK